MSIGMTIVVAIDEPIETKGEYVAMGEPTSFYMDTERPAEITIDGRKFIIDSLAENLTTLKFKEGDATITFLGYFVD